MSIPLIEIEARNQIVMRFVRGFGDYNCDMANHPDVLIVGGGIIGLTSAYFLAKSGVTVEVIDRGELGREASWAGAGIIPPGNPEHAATPADKLRAFSTAQFASFSDELRERTGINNGFLRCGGIEFLDDHDRYVLELWQNEGIDFEHVPPEVLHAREPHLAAPSLDAYRLPTMGQVRNPWHLRALIAACESVGVRLSPRTSFIGWGQIRKRVIAVQTMSANRKPAGQFLVAGGAWAASILRPLGYQLPVAPVRGQIVLFRPERPVLSHVVTVGKRYLVPRADGRILVGSTEEPEAGFEKANTPEGIRELTEFAWNLVPALREVPIEQTWAGLRPGSPDGMPFLGPVPETENVFAAVGHFRAGVQLSLGTAQIVTHAIRKEPLPIPIEAFRLTREPDYRTRPAFRS